MPNLLFRKVLSIVRILLLFISLLGVLGLVLWSYYPDKIKSLDSYIVGRYTSYHQDRLNDARELVLSGQQDRAMEVYAQMLGRMSHVYRQDSLWPVKRRALLALVNLYQKARNFSQARYWLELWLKLDERDLAAQHRYAKLLCSLPEDREAGVNRIEALYRKFPNYGNIFADYFSLSVKRKDAPSFCAILRDYYERLLVAANGEWKVSWLSSEGANQMRAYPIMEPGGKIIMRATLSERPLGGLRLDAPPWPHYLMSAKIEFRSGVRKQALNLVPGIVKISPGVKALSADIYETSSKEPFWVVTLSDFAEWNDQINVILTGTWLPVLPKQVIAYLKKHGGQDSEKAVHDTVCKGYEKVVALPLERRFAGRTGSLADGNWVFPKGKYHEIIGAPVEVFWTNPENPHFSEKFKRRAPLALKGNRFDSMEFSVHDHISSLRIDPPPAVFATYRDLQIEITTDHGPRVLDLKDLDIRLHDMKRIGVNAFQALGKDPFLYFTLSKEPLYVNKVKISATIDEKFLRVR
jgi:tetratricopeptide (TPR) repeat protein